MIILLLPVESELWLDSKTLDQTASYETLTIANKSEQA